MTIRQRWNRTRAEWGALYQASPWTFWLTAVMVIGALALQASVWPASTS